MIVRGRARLSASSPLIAHRDSRIGWSGCHHALTAVAGSAALAKLQPVAVGILEDRDVAPGVLEHIGVELHAARLQDLECLPAILRVDGVRRRAAALVRLALPGCSRPEC